MDYKTMRGLRKLTGILLAFFTLCVVNACKDEEDPASMPYDPDRPVVIDRFTPTEGGAKVRMILYGNNFGTDKSIVSVKVGGKEAITITVKNTNIYCIVPEECYEGTVEVTVGEQTATAASKYKYVPRTMVTTLCGYVDELGQGDVIPEGPFDNCGKIENAHWFSFDPQNPDILYMVQGTGYKNIRIFDLANEYVYTTQVNAYSVSFMNTITWTRDGDMVIACPQNTADRGCGNLIFKRNPRGDGLDFKDVAPQKLTSSRACKASLVLPQTGELYFSFRTWGSVFKYNFEENGYDNNLTINNAQKEGLMFTVPDRQCDFSFVMHPDGLYAYLIMHEKHYIMRSNFDEETQSLVNPYIVCGASGQAGYQDLTGTSARISTPGQGVFVYNEEYEKAGKRDHYDFYFCDSGNHCVRKLTPDGIVSTFAGRGSRGANGDPWGYINGEVREDARFNTPYGLAYDEKRKAFYVGDVQNRRIRKIAMEEIPDEYVEDAASDDTQGEESTSN